MKKLTIISLVVINFLICTLQARELPRVRDIGVLGLFSHDLFSWDAETETNSENGRLDLSTLFDYEDGSLIDQGGNPKNADNALVYSTVMTLVDYYKLEYQVSLGTDEEKHQKARRKTIALFHVWVRDSFERLTSMKFPETGVDGDVSNEEQAAMRALHDILPGWIALKRWYLPFARLNVTDWKFARMRLNEEELNQSVNEYDGKYDSEYFSVEIPFAWTTINLLELDREFVESQTLYIFDDMLAELALFGQSEIAFESISFSKHLMELASKAICSNDNEWLPVVVCD